MPVSARLPAALLALAALAAACAGPGAPGRGRPSEAEQSSYQAAVGHLPDDPRTAAAELEAFFTANPNSALADDAAEELARLALVEGRRDDAFRWLETLLERYPDGDRADAARVRLARWEVGRDDPVRARAYLAAVRPDRLEPADRRAYFRLSAQLAADPVDRVLQLAGLRASIAEELAAARSGAGEAAAAARLEESLGAVDGELEGLLLALNGEQLGRLATALDGPPPAARVRLILAAQALEAGDVAGAQRLAERARRYELTRRDEERLANLELRLGLGGALAAPSALPTFAEAAAQPRIVVGEVGGTLAAVLPLSGPYAEFGQDALRGVLLAAGIFDAAPGDASAAGADAAPRPRVRLLVRDTAGVPERAATAVRELAGEPDLVAIVGPIFSDEAEAAAREAEAARVPLLTLSNRAELARERDWVFRLRITPDDEVGFLVDYAFEKLGARRFAVLYPESRYGRGMRERYWDAVVARGGAIVAVAAYDPESTDYAGSIRSMVGYDLLTRRERRALEERAAALKRGRRFEPARAALLRRTLGELLGPEAEPLPPVVDFDALFIPDSHERIGLLAPQLAYHEVGGMRLLGTGEWDDPELLRVAQQHVRGAVISTPFDRDSPFDEVRSFVADYQASFGVAPESLGADAFDAARLALEQIALGRTSRGAVRDGLLRVRGRAGPSGVLQIESDGNARKRPFLLEVRSGRFVPVDAAD